MSSKDKKVAYIVVCWNNRKIIDECLKSLKRQTYKPTDIYVIDNASSDGSADYIAKHHPEVKLIRSSVNTAFAKGNNIVIKEALKDETVAYIALINSDAVIDKEWTAEIVKYIHDKPRVAGVQGITLDYYDHKTVDAEHIFVASNFQSTQHGYGETYKEAYAHPRKVFGVNAAAAIYTRKFIEEQPQQKLFDEKFYMYLEDVDVSFRAIMSGWSNYYIPSARAYHMGSVSAKKRSNGYNLEMTFRNQAALLFKNIPLSVFLANLPEAWRMEKHFYLHLYRNFGPVTMMRIIRARIVGILRLPLYIGDRLRLAKKRKINNATLNRAMRNRGIFS